MDLIVIMGPQAVGKMTIGRELEKKIDAKLLHNHETIDLFANFLGYGNETFRLSDQTRKELFRAFVRNETNVTDSIIFTVVAAFDLDEDIEFLKEISAIFAAGKGRVFLIELEADLETRLERNVGESRLKAKPSKRNLDFSRNELLTTHEKHRLNSLPNEVEEKIQHVNYLRINNTYLEPEEIADRIAVFIQSKD
ncbi:AAA family ATPase [Desemzia sp. RIT804]|uniref:AAA family ATPase n=1 Tax=Desemzia sp. RIT 804 TaxID=2810209 RepID=UPI0019526C9D|nr:AAA family ATPase [Desemzia sp. RIT 804]MBM6616022.1 AAA family ATPase [Desemzia sp. RIT 804]